MLRWEAPALPTTKPFPRFVFPAQHEMLTGARDNAPDAEARLCQKHDLTHSIDRGAGQRLAEVCPRIDTIRKLVTVRRLAASVPVWIFCSVAVLALAAGLAWASELGDVLIESTTMTSVTATPTASPTTTASSTLSPTLTPTPIPDRDSCGQIRDTKYRSVNERKWFLRHCVTPTWPAPAVSVQSQDWRALVCSYDWDCTWAMAVIACESGGNPNAYNPAGPYVGLFQILDPSSSLFDPATNIAEAHWKYQSQGPGAWWGCP